MRLHILFIFLFIVSVGFTNGQGNVPYNNIVNRAEMSIVKKEYSKALFNYSELKKQNYIFSRDIYNALLCANKIKNWKEVSYWGKLFIQKGATVNFFNQLKFKEYRNTEYYSKLYNSKQKSLVIKKLVKSLDSLTTIDQNQFVKLKQDPNTKVYHLTEEIDKQLFRLEKRHSKISEESTGINIQNDTVYFFRPTYAVLYRHSYQSHLPNSYFNEKIKNNELERVLYYNNIDYNLMPIIDYKNKLYYLKPNILPIEIKDDFINFQEITKIAYKNKDFDSFSFYYPISKVANFIDEQSEKNFEIMLQQLYIQ